jgi:hypothetical protein
MRNITNYINEQRTKWNVSNCGYNPSYQDMVDGKYKN